VRWLPSRGLAGCGPRGPSLETHAGRGEGADIELAWVEKPPVGLTRRLQRLEQRVWVGPYRRHEEAGPTSIARLERAVDARAVDALAVGARGLPGGSERGAALGSVIDAIALVGEPDAQVRDERLPSALLAGLRSVVVAALGGHRRTGCDRTHRHRHRTGHQHAPHTPHPTTSGLCVACAAQAKPARTPKQTPREESSARRQSVELVKFGVGLTLLLEPPLVLKQSLRCRDRAAPGLLAQT